MTGRVLIARTVGTTTLLLALCGKNARRRVGYAVDLGLRRVRFPPVLVRTDWGARGGEEANFAPKLNFCLVIKITKFDHWALCGGGTAARECA